jgi:hypothetical protein
VGEHETLSLFFVPRPDGIDKTAVLGLRFRNSSIVYALGEQQGGFTEIQAAVGEGEQVVAGQFDQLQVELVVQGAECLYIKGFACVFECIHTIENLIQNAGSAPFSQARRMASASKYARTSVNCW